MSSTLLQILIALGIVQGLLLGSLLFLYPGSMKLLSKTLAMILILSMLLLFSELAEVLEPGNTYHSVLRFATLLDLLLVVAIWGMVLVIMEKKQALGKQDLWHVLPFAIGLLWLVTGFGQFGAAVPGSFSHIPDNVGLLVGYKGLIWAGYMGMSLWVAYGQDTPSDPIGRKKQRRLLQRLLWPFIGITAISYLVFWLMYFGIGFPLDSDYLASLLIVAFVYFLTLTILREPGQFIRLRAGFSRPKYYKSGLDAPKLAEHQEQLLRFIENDKPYLDEQLGLNDLARAMQLPPNSLSQVINEGLGKSFNDFLNAYRLQEVKRKLLDPSEDRKTILALAYESGFQSKASFNRIFKKAEGMTPTRFRKKFRSQPTR